MILDVAAGVLIAAFIIAVVAFGVALVGEARGSGHDAGGGFITAWVGILAGAALVVWRLLHAFGISN